MRIIVALLIAASCAASAAEWAPASDRTMPAGFVSKTGLTMDGGIPARSNPSNYHDAVVSYGADPTGATNTYSNIESARAACSAEHVLYLPPGKYRMDSTLTLPLNGPPITIRGSGNFAYSTSSNSVGTGSKTFTVPAGIGWTAGVGIRIWKFKDTDVFLDGTVTSYSGTTLVVNVTSSAGSGTVSAWAVGITIIDARASAALRMGLDPDFTNVGNAQTTITASAGTTTLSVTSNTASSFAAGRHFRISTTDDDPLKITSPNGRVGRDWVGYVIGKSGSDITFLPELPYDVSGAPITQMQLNSLLRCGVEDLTIMGTDGNLENGIIVAITDQCWVKGVFIVDHAGYGINMRGATRAEIRGNWIEKARVAGTSKSGILVDSGSRGLIIHNVVRYNGPTIEYFQNTVGFVAAYNKTTGGTAGDLVINHGPYSFKNLTEGNRADVIQSDGYHAGDQHQLIFRNRATVIALKRMSLDHTVVGNLYDPEDLSLGDPQIGNSFSLGTSSIYGASCTLTSRTSSTAGVIAAPTGHGVTNGTLAQVYWAEMVEGYLTSRIRYDVTVSVSGNNLTISGGFGHNLPEASSVVYIPTTNDSIRDYPLDWDTSTHAPRVWLGGTLLTRIGDADAIVRWPTGYGAQIAAHSVASNGNKMRVTGLFEAVIASISGDDVTYTDGKGGAFGAQGSTVEGVPSIYGFYEKHLDVIARLHRYANWNPISTAGEPPLPGGTTMPNSLFLTEKPAEFASLTWPPFDPTNPSASANAYDVLPAAYWEQNGVWPSAAPTVIHQPARMTRFKR